MSVGWSEVMGGFWVVSRFEDCHYVLQHHDLFSARYNTVPPAQFTALGPDIPTHIDPPEHGKYRTILNPALSPDVAASLEPQMRQLVTQLLDPIVENGRCDFLEELAVPYPSQIFVRLMGLPPLDIGMFLDWKDQILRTHDPEGVRRVWDTVKVRLVEYFGAIYDRRSELDDPGQDLIGRLIRARYNGERPLTRDEFVRISCLVWGAGLDTVTAQLSLAIHYLGTHPDRRDELVADPGLIPSASEELLRYDSLVNDCRVATADVELGGQLIKAGDTVMLLYGAAGRDPEQFPNPNEVDFRRFPNRHLGFGGGAHRCVGSHLARLELRVAMEEIHRRIPTYRVDPSHPVERHFGYVRGIGSLHLVMD
jgi:cytochrome P450